MLFLTCEVGHRCSSAFNEIYELECQLEWYRYPIEVQQIFRLITLNARKPMEIAFFGSSTCSREQFKKVWF